MVNTVGQLRDWLLKKQPFRTGRLEKDIAYSSLVDNTLAELPATLSEQITQLIKTLPNPPDEQAAIQDALSTAIAKWRANPRAANNSLIILASPVSAVARILTDSLTDWGTENELTLAILDWAERPADLDQIVPSLRRALERMAPNTGDARVAIVPNLSWCFLRSAEGLDGMDYFRDHLLSDRNQFWIIGSGQVGFQYLNAVLKLKAYCGEIITLPKLSGEQLQMWLMPVIEQMNIHVGDDFTRNQLEDPGEDRAGGSWLGLTTLLDMVGTRLSTLLRGIRRNIKRSIKQDVSSLADLGAPHPADTQSRWKDYFRRLSDLSEGASTVALQLFVTSIHCQEIEDPPQTDSKAADSSPSPRDRQRDSESSPRHRLVAGLPKLPNLPKLEHGDLYILYSLLVHDDLTLTALAESLGEERQLVNDSIQMLRKKGIVEQWDEVVKVNPIHYPRLKHRLAANNFIIDAGN